MNRTSLFRGLPLVAAGAIFMSSAVGCGASDGNGNGGGGGGGTFQSSLKGLTGKLGKMEGSNKARITAIVGTGGNKRQIPAKIDPKSGTFRVDDLPEGPKSLVIEQGGKTRSVTFPLHQESKDKRIGVVPETRLKSSSFDLGTLNLAANGEHFEPQFNPMATLVDTDGDGIFDFFDDDISGNGIPNWEDQSIFGDDWADYADWSWDMDMFWLSDWDCDGDGSMDWEDWGSGDDINWGSCGWDSDWDEFWGDDYWEGDDYGWDEYLNELCAEDPMYCDEWSGEEWGDDEWGDDEWGSEGWEDEDSDW